MSVVDRKGGRAPLHSGPADEQPVSNARLCAELQVVTLAIRMFGLKGLASMSAERVQKAAENEQVRS